MRHFRDGWVPPDLRRTYYFGVDLGQRKDHTTLAVLERRWKMATPEEFQHSAGLARHGEWIYEVIQLERVELGTSYTDAADWIREAVNQIDPRLPRTVILDGSGVGAAVRDYMRRRGMFGAQLINAVITRCGNSTEAGGFPRSTGHGTYVPRLELLTRLAVAVENREFRIDPKRCEAWRELKEELVSMRMQGKPEGGGSDDLAFALALAVWWGIRGV